MQCKEKHTLMTIFGIFRIFVLISTDVLEMKIKTMPVFFPGCLMFDIQELLCAKSYVFSGSAVC